MKPTMLQQEIWPSKLLAANAVTLLQTTPTEMALITAIAAENRPMRIQTSLLKKRTVHTFLMLNFCAMPPSKTAHVTARPITTQK
jgi:hypothetical protein